MINILQIFVLDNQNCGMMCYVKFFLILDCCVCNFVFIYMRNYENIKFCISK